MNNQNFSLKPPSFYKKRSNSSNCECDFNTHTKTPEDCKNTISSSHLLESFKNDDDYKNILNLFGLDLYFDDILILFLLFILYKEDVADTYLYIVLILLLLS